MYVMMLTKWSPNKGKVLAPGQVVEVPDEVALDMMGRGLAREVRLEESARPADEHRGTVADG